MPIPSQDFHRFSGARGSRFSHDTKQEERQSKRQIANAKGQSTGNTGSASKHSCQSNSIVTTTCIFHTQTIHISDQTKGEATARRFAGSVCGCADFVTTCCRGRVAALDRPPKRSEHTSTIPDCTALPRFLLQPGSEVSQSEITLVEARLFCSKGSPRRFYNAYPQ